MRGTLVKIGGVLRRHWGGLTGILLFQPLAQVLVYLAVDPSRDQEVALGIGAAWLALLFASVWLIDELLREEWRAGAVEHYLIAGVEERFFWEWFLVGGILVFVLGLAGWATAALFYRLPEEGWRWVVAATALYAWGTVGLTVLVRLLAHGAGAGQFLGPLLLFPLETPILLAAVQISRAAWLGGDIGPARWMLLGAFFGILYVALGTLVAPLLLRE